jgi:diguanylate cyclase (GGDEF)-like protein
VQPVIDTRVPHEDAAKPAEPTLLPPLPAPVAFLARLVHAWSLPVAVAAVAVAAGALAASLAYALTWIAQPTSGPLTMALLSGLFAAGAAAAPTALLLGLLDDMIRTRAQLQEQLRERWASEVRLRRLAETDELTGLLNRRAFFSRAAAITSLARRHDQPISVVIVDIDNFKGINDRYGHAAGDRALRELADAIRSEARTSDLVARLGGDEFVVLMPMTAPDGARRFAERLRQRRTRVASKPLTVSMGLAAAAGAEVDIGTLLSEADRMLYAAKAAGRNCIFPPADATTGSVSAG